jgi:hypothetical protein
MSQPSDAVCTKVRLNGHKMSTSTMHKSPALWISFGGCLVGSQLLQHQPSSHSVPLKTVALCTSQNTHMTSDFRQKTMKLAPTGNIFHQVIPGFSPDCSTGSSEMLYWCSDTPVKWLTVGLDNFILIPTTHMNPLPATTASIPVLRPTHPAVKGTFYGV